MDMYKDMDMGVDMDMDMDMNNPLLFTKYRTFMLTRRPCPLCIVYK